MGDRLILSPNHSLLYHLCNYLPEGAAPPCLSYDPRNPNP